jgi:acetyl esterase/lipase
MKMLVTLILTALCGGSFAAETPAKAKDNDPAGKPEIYKTSASKERQMEIYFPPNHEPAKSKVPGMILFHGGGWQGGTLQ